METTGRAAGIPPPVWTDVQLALYVGRKLSVDLLLCLSSSLFNCPLCAVPLGHIYEGEPFSLMRMTTVIRRESESAESAKPACLGKVTAFLCHWQMSWISGCRSLPFRSGVFKTGTEGLEDGDVHCYTPFLAHCMRIQHTEIPLQNTSLKFNNMKLAFLRDRAL